MEKDKVYVFEGKTTNEAIEKGLKELKVSKNKVDIVVLENEEKRSFFSILEPRVVKVQIKLKDDVETFEKSPNTSREKTIISFDEIEKNLDAFLKQFIGSLPKNDFTYKMDYDGKYLKIDINGENAGYLIGYRGEVLNSIQAVLTNIVNKNSKDKIKVMLNIGGYREKREKDLENLAMKIASSVIKTGRNITLEPMTAYERKIIHTKLQTNNKVKTYSVGEEPRRKVVVALNK